MAYFRRGVSLFYAVGITRGCAVGVRIYLGDVLHNQGGESSHHRNHLRSLHRQRAVFIQVPKHYFSPPLSHARTLRSSFYPLKQNN